MWEMFKDAAGNIFGGILAVATGYWLFWIERRSSAKDDFHATIKYLSRISSSNLPPDLQARVHYLKAYAFLKLQRYPEGIAEAENAMMNSPDEEWPWQIAARLYALVRHDDKTWLKPALQFWQRFLAMFPNDKWAWAEIGFVYWFLRKGGDKLSQQALNAFEKSIELGLKDSGLILDRIGHLYQEMGNWVEAEKAYRKAYSANPNQFGYCFGVSLMHFGRYLEALPLMLAAAEKHQPDALSWYNLAVCLEKTEKGQTGNIEKVQVAYKKAIEIEPNFAEAWFNFGGFYWNQGDQLTAYSIWKVAIQKFPNHPDCERVRTLLVDPFQKK